MKPSPLNSEEAPEEVPLSRVVLVVDDEPLVREVTASMLEELGCEVITAASGTEALQRLSSDRRIEILITDINMPEMDGYELAERAQHMRERLKVIALSGREQDGSGLPFIRKPFLAQDLKAVMAQHTGLC
ncbi:MAG: response regulator [Xanthobacteraceae bacterium]